MMVYITTWLDGFVHSMNTFNWHNHFSGNIWKFATRPPLSRPLFAVIRWCSRRISTGMSVWPSSLSILTVRIRLFLLSSRSVISLLGVRVHRTSRNELRQLKAEHDHESRNVIAIEGSKFVMHKRTKINHFTEMCVIVTPSAARSTLAVAGKPLGHYCKWNCILFIFMITCCSIW